VSAALERLRRLLPALWLGLVLGVAFVAAPAPFAVLSSADAGRVNGRIFLTEAWIGVALALLLWLLERARARRAVQAGQGSMLSTEMILLVGTLLCTFAGYFALQTMLPAARAGQGSLSFAQLHAISVALFALKALLVGALAWRAAGS
jgi:Domain of unknown function (DUF4149)